MGGGRLLQRQRGPRALRRSPRRHRPLSARALREAVPVHAGAQSRLVRCVPRPTARRRASCSPAASTRRISRKGASTPRTPAGACRSSIASCSTASARTSPASTSSCRAITTTAASSRKASMRWSRATACRRRWPARGMRLDKEVEPTIFYVGFNMEDPVLGTPAGEKGRKLRQAMSTAIEFEALSRAVPQRPRRAGTGTGAAGDLRLRRELQEPVPPVRRRPRAPAAGRGRLPQRHRSQDRAAAAAELRHLGDDGRGEPAVPVPGRRLARDRPRHRGQRHHLQPIPGQGAARRLPDLHLGLAGRLSRSRELPVPARVRVGSLQERRARTRPTSATPSSTASTAR